MISKQIEYTRNNLHCLSDAIDPIGAQDNSVPGFHRVVARLPAWTSIGNDTTTTTTTTTGVKYGHQSAQCGSIFVMIFCINDLQ